jgi:hypothetical protein
MSGGRVPTLDSQDLQDARRRLNTPSAPVAQWLRFKYQPGADSLSDRIVYGYISNRAGLFLGRFVEVTLCKVPEFERDSPEPAGTLYIEADKIYEHGAETSFVVAHEQRETAESRGE